jgi:hypothetical protein
MLRQIALVGVIVLVSVLAFAIYSATHKCHAETQHSALEQAFGAIGSSCASWQR